MAIQNFFTSRDNNANASTYVGQLDRLWYNTEQNALYVSDGTTAGGVPVGTGPGVDILANNVTANNIAVNTISNDDSTEVKFTSDVTFDDEVTVNGNLSIVGNISPATTTKIGGVRAGPGANISNTGLLTIDSANVPFSFGNFFASNNILSIVNSDENMILETDGNAEIQLVGNIGFYKENGMPPAVENRYFWAKDDGQIFIYVSDEDPLEAAVDIVGTTSGNVIPPGIEGAMLQVTGQANIPCRVYYDGVNNYVSWVGRRFNGNVDSPTQVLAGEDIIRINATAATDAGVGNVATVQISATALEDQTTAAQGSSLTFTVTPIGSAATSRVDVANITVADGVAATKFTTSGTVTATGNITGGNLSTSGIASAATVTATGNVTGGNITTGGEVAATGNITGGNLISGGDIMLTGNIASVDVLKFDTETNPTADAEGEIFWSDADGTIDIQMNDGVNQPVGQSQYMLALNETGDTIVKGTFVGFAGAGNNGNSRIKIASFLANGAQPSLYAVGITSQAIANAAQGYVTTFGVVRDIDTTGNAVSQTWGVGNILYANPDVTGALTNVKPTAPDNVIPVAAVLKVDATEGEIFVRPTIEQKMSYGVFTRLSDLTLAGANTANAVPLTNTEISNGVSIADTASRLVVDQSGLYQIAITAQFDTTGGTFDEDAFYIWLRKNGTDVDNTMRRGGIDGEIPDGVTASSTRTLSLDANDYIEVVIAVSNTRVFLQYNGATAFGPATAALEVSVTQVQL